MNAKVDLERKELEDRFLTFARSQLPQATGLRVRLNGRSGEGDSHQNWFVDLMHDGECLRRVLRRNGQSIAAESDRVKEFRLLQCLQRAGVYAPKVEWLDATGEHLGRPAFTMELCPGRSDLLAMTEGNSFGWDVTQRIALGRRLTELMVRIHSLDWKALGIGTVLEVPDHPAASRLRGILREIERLRLEPYPEFAEVIDWLERRMPRPRPPVLTHGDFRAVQVLLGEGGEFYALLDWEFARLSDPVDEVAYFTAPTQAPLHLIPGAWEQEDFVSCYERASHRSIDRAELHWWQVLNMLWVMSFVLQAMRGIIEHRTDALRTAQFNTRLMNMLLSLIGI